MLYYPAWLLLLEVEAPHKKVVIGVFHAPWGLTSVDLELVDIVKFCCQNGHAALRSNKLLLWTH